MRVRELLCVKLCSGCEFCFNICVYGLFVGICRVFLAGFGLTSRFLGFRSLFWVCLCGAAKFLVRKGVSDYLFVSKNIDC